MEEREVVVVVVVVEKKRDKRDPALAGPFYRW